MAQISIISLDKEVKTLSFDDTITLNKDTFSSLNENSFSI